MLPSMVSARVPVLGLSLGLLLTGCYVGVDPDALSGSDASSGVSVSATITQGSADDTSSSSGGEASGGESSGALDPTTGDGTTGDATTTDDVTTSGDATTGDVTTTGDGTTSTTSDGTTSTTSGGSTSTSGGMGEYCDADDDWDPAWASLEEQVLEVVNQVRAEGADCGSKGSFGAAGPLTMHPLLRCAARLHSKDMVVRNFFNHVNPDGEDPWDRIAKTGYGGYQTAGENIAGGSGTAAGVMDQWMNSDGHCANIMNPAFNQIGVGYYPGGMYGHMWTQVFTKK